VATCVSGRGWRRWTAAIALSLGMGTLFAPCLHPSEKDSAAMTVPTSGHNWKQWLEEMKAAAPPTSIDRPFQVVAEKQETVAVNEGRSITVLLYDVDIPYLDMDAQPAVGKAQLMIPADMKTPAPIVMSVYYGTSPAGAARFLAQGWAVMTPLASPPLYGQGNNASLAMIQAARAMPFVDGAHLAITGNSAGGYMTLMTASEMFPVAAAAANVPIVNTAYNAAYAAKNAAAAHCREKDAQGSDASLVPVFCFIVDGLRGAARPIGDPDRDAANFIHNSPVGVLDLITCPVQFQFSTADTLVPVNQVGPEYAYPTPPSFPPDFTFDMNKLLDDPSARITLLEALKGRRVEVFRFQPPEGLTPSWEKAAPADHQATRNLSYPFSKAADFSIVVMDEGPPDPRIGHLKYHLPFGGADFIQYWLRKARPIKAGQLTAAKLTMLMRRFVGQRFEEVENHTTKSGVIAPINRRNHPGKERLDVILGLRAYSEADPSYALRLARLYARLAPELRVLDAHEGRRTARFQDDVAGGLAFNEAVLHYRWGDKDKAARLAYRLVRTKRHEAYAACLPPELRMASTLSVSTALETGMVDP